MPRLMLADELWSKLEKILLRQAIYQKPDLRMTVESHASTGCVQARPAQCLRMLELGLQALQCMVGGCKWLKVFQALIEEPDLEWAFIDCTYVEAHQHSAGAASDQPEAIGKSRAGLTSRIHLAVDAQGLPVAFEIIGGNVNDCTSAPDLIAQLSSAEVIVADKGHDCERIREQIEAQGARAVIPRKHNSIKGNTDLDRGLYRYRHLVENAFARLKHYRTVAFRYDKLKRNYESMVAMACGFLWLPM